jgi:hypothetical protein
MVGIEDGAQGCFVLCNALVRIVGVDSSYVAVRRGRPAR